MAALPQPSQPLCTVCGSTAGAHIRREQEEIGEGKYVCNMLKEDGTECEASGTNSSNAFSHAKKEHQVDDPCVRWSTGEWKHRKHRPDGEEKQQQVTCACGRVEPHLIGERVRVGEAVYVCNLGDKNKKGDKCTFRGPSSKAYHHAEKEHKETDPCVLYKGKRTHPKDPKKPKRQRRGTQSKQLKTPKRSTTPRSAHRRTSTSGSDGGSADAVGAELSAVDSQGSSAGRSHSSLSEDETDTTSYPNPLPPLPLAASTAAYQDHHNFSPLHRQSAANPFILPPQQIASLPVYTPPHHGYGHGHHIHGPDTQLDWSQALATVGDSQMFPVADYYRVPPNSRRSSATSTPNRAGIEVEESKEDRNYAATRGVNSIHGRHAYGYPNVRPQSSAIEHGAPQQLSQQAAPTARVMFPPTQPQQQKTPSSTNERKESSTYSERYAVVPERMMSSHADAISSRSLLSPASTTWSPSSSLFLPSYGGADIAQQPFVVYQRQRTPTSDTSVPPPSPPMSLSSGFPSPGPTSNSSSPYTAYSVLRSSSTSYTHLLRPLPLPQVAAPTDAKHQHDGNSVQPQHHVASASVHTSIRPHYGYADGHHNHLHSLDAQPSPGQAYGGVRVGRGSPTPHYNPLPPNSPQSSPSSTCTTAAIKVEEHNQVSNYAAAGGVDSNHAYYCGVYAGVYASMPLQSNTTEYRARSHLFQRAAPTDRATLQPTQAQQQHTPSSTNKRKEPPAFNTTPAQLATETRKRTMSCFTDAASSHSPLTPLSSMLLSPSSSLSLTSNEDVNMVQPPFDTRKTQRTRTSGTSSPASPSYQVSELSESSSWTQPWEPFSPFTTDTDSIPPSLQGHDNFDVNSLLRMED